jgi:hypothetical protein
MIKEHVTRKGQAYYDRRIYVKPRPIPVLQESVMKAIGTHVQRQPIHVGHERVELEWVKP